MRYYKIFAIFPIIVLIFSKFAISGDFVKLTENDKVTLPEDMYFKDNFSSQWWYFTGHLKSDSGESFGYELTFFVINVSKKRYKSKFGLNRIYISHFAITDIDGKKYYFEDDTSRGAYGEAFASDKMLNVKVFDDELSGDLNKIYLKANAKNFKIDFVLKPDKKPLLNGKDGYSNKIFGCPECASLYFSITRLDTKGTILIDEKKYSVTGKSWFDREINSDYETTKLKGWDWFSIMLDDKREILIYRIRNKNEVIDKSSYVAIVEKNGEKRELNFDDIKLTPLKYYVSKKTKSKYPIKWEMVIDNKKLIVETLVKDQEFLAQNSTFNHYYEGACKVYGDMSGLAYMELTGY